MFATRLFSGCSAAGSALRSGRRGREFESRHPDKSPQFLSKIRSSKSLVFKAFFIYLALSQSNIRSFFHRITSYKKKRVENPPSLFKSRKILIKETSKSFADLTHYKTAHNRRTKHIGCLVIKHVIDSNLEGKAFIAPVVTQS